MSDGQTFLAYLADRNDERLAFIGSIRAADEGRARRKLKREHDLEQALETYGDMVGLTDFSGVPDADAAKIMLMPRRATSSVPYLEVVDR